MGAEGTIVEGVKSFDSVKEVSGVAQNFAAPIWMTFKQASELDAHIRKGEKGSLPPLISQSKPRFRRNMSPIQSALSSTQRESAGCR